MPGILFTNGQKTGKSLAPSIWLEPYEIAIFMCQKQVNNHNLIWFDPIKLTIG
jgi:hypothetical protein